MALRALPEEEAGGVRRVVVWEWEGEARDEGDGVAAWLSKFLGKSCRLARYIGIPLSLSPLRNSLVSPLPGPPAHRCPSSVLFLLTLGSFVSGHSTVNVKNCGLIVLTLALSCSLRCFLGSGRTSNRPTERILVKPWLALTPGFLVTRGARIGGPCRGLCEETPESRLGAFWRRNHVCGRVPLPPRDRGGAAPPLSSKTFDECSDAFSQNVTLDAIKACPLVKFIDSDPQKPACALAHNTLGNENLVMKMRDRRELRSGL